MVSEAQKRANAKYRKKMTQITVRFSPNEQKVYAYAKEQENVSGYIKRLIIEDMEREGRA